jgi:hypothetical protein
VAAERKAEDLTRHAHPGATLAKQAAEGDGPREESDAADR